MPCRAIFNILIALAACAVPALAVAYGEPDPAFMPARFQYLDCAGGAIAPRPDGNAFVPLTTAMGTPDAIGKFKPDGSIDATWGAGGVATIAGPAPNIQGRTPFAPARDGIMPLPDGSVLVVVDTIQKLTPAGAVDTRYGTNGVSDKIADFPTEIVSSVALPDGSAVALISQPWTSPTAYFTRIRPDGRRDTSFGSGGYLSAPFAPNIVAWSVLSDGSVEVTFLSSGRLVLQRLPVGLPTPAGRLLPEPGLASSTSPAINVDAEGRVYSAMVTATGISLVRYTSAGDEDTTFGHVSIPLPRNSAGVTTEFATDSLWRSASGGWTALARFHYTAVVGFVEVDAGSSLAAVRFRADGTPDPAFKQGSPLQSSGRVVRLDDGKLLGTVQQYGGPADHGCSLVRALTDEPDVEATIIEYFHPLLQHYFLAVDGSEAGVLDDNDWGWVRTGRTFGAWRPVPEEGTTRICRFYGDPVIGPNSHFYTPEGYECDLLRAIELATPPGVPVWHLEQKPFEAVTPKDVCPPNLDPVYRVFSGPVSVNGPNHRYTTDASLYAQMQAKGWLPEGVHFCVPPRLP